MAEEPPPAAEEPETPAGSLDLGEDEEDMYLTFAPGAKKAVAPPSPAPAPVPEAPAAPAPPPAPAPAPEPAPPVSSDPPPAAPAPAEAPVPAAAPAPTPVPVAAAPPAAPPSPSAEPEPVAAEAKPEPEPEQGDPAGAAAATGAVVGAAAAAAATPKPKRGLGRLKKPNIPKLPQIPNLPPEVQQFAPGVAGEIGQANAEVAAVPQAARLPSAGQEFDQAMPDVAEHVAEAQAVVGDTPGAPSIPKPHVSHTREPIAPAAAAAATPEAPAPEVHEQKRRAAQVAGAAAGAAAAATGAAPAASAASPPAASPPAVPPSPPTAEPPAAGQPEEQHPPSMPLAPDLRITVPPDKAPKAVEHPSFVLTDAVKALDQEKETKAKIKPLWILVALGIVAVVVVGVIVLAGGGSSKKAATTQTTATTPSTTARTTTTTVAPPVIPEVPPATIQQQVIARGRRRRFARRRLPGRRAIERLSECGTLKPIASTTDPGGPTSISQSYGRVFVTDNGTIATYKLNDLSPIGAVAFPGAYALAGGGAHLPLFALSRGSIDSGRLCAVTQQAVSPCASLPFAPSGGGVDGISSSKSIVYVTDRASASVVPYTATKTTVTAGTPIKLPRQPQGDPVAIGSTLYVPVRRGIAVIDTDTGKVLSTIALPVSPLSLVANGKKQLFAALFSTNQVAAVTLSKPGATPTIKLVGAQKGPVAPAAERRRLHLRRQRCRQTAPRRSARRPLAVTTVSKLPRLGSNTPPITAQSAEKIVAR